MKQAGHLSKPLFPGEKSCHLCMCHFCLAALSHLLAHFARAGEICATCHCLPVWEWDWWNILSVMTTATDGVFTSLCVEKENNGHESILFSPTGQEKIGLILFLKQEITFTSSNYSYWLMLTECTSQRIVKNNDHVRLVPADLFCGYVLS